MGKSEYLKFKWIESGRFPHVNCELPPVTTFIITWITDSSSACAVSKCLHFSHFMLIIHNNVKVDIILWGLLEDKSLAI